MNNASADTAVSVPKKPAKTKAKTSSSKKSAPKKVQPKATETKAFSAASVAKAHGLNPKRLRTRLRAESINAPYDAKAILEIERIAKEMAKS